VAYSRSSATDGTATTTILPDTSRAPMAVHQMGYNLIYYLFPTEEGARVRPFFTVGVHFSDFDLPSTASPGGSSLKWGLNYGGGFKYRISSLFGLRFDVRGYDTRKPNWGGALSNQSGLLQQTEASVGFGVYF